MMMQGVDSASFISVYIEALFGDTQLGDATGFLWLRPDSQLALVTNWHVASGRNNETKVCIHSKGGIPDRLRVYLPALDLADPPRIVTVMTVDSEGKPLWTEHPNYGAEADVVALPFEIPLSDVNPTIPANMLRLCPLKQRIGMPVFILGFPFGRMGVGLPVWKQGTFASEPFLASRGIDRFLIVDTASRPGMSGSPVIQRVHGEVEFETGEAGKIQNGDGAARFVGIYSGRFHTSNASDAQLGRVWPERLIIDIIKHMLLDKNGI